MPSCREIDPLFVPYVDGLATADERAVVDAHLKACPKCRHHTALQAAVRTTVREKLCRPSAPEALHARCRAAARAGIGPFGTTGNALATLSMAAALMLVVGGVLLYTLTGLPTVLAAQLTIDHVKCFAVEAGETPIAVPDGEAQYIRDYGQNVRLPHAEIAGLQLVGMRRCYCGEGAAAHAMYRLNGRSVSLFVIPDVGRARASADVFGHDAVIWSRQNVTYVLVSREPRETLERLARQMDAGL